MLDFASNGIHEAGLGAIEPVVMYQATLRELELDLEAWDPCELDNAS